MLDGKRLIELPDKEVSLVKLEFSQEERDIYKMVCLPPNFLLHRAHMVFAGGSQNSG
jgi:hypothetical protein